MSDNSGSFAGLVAGLDVVVILDAINSLKKQMSKSNKRMVNMIQSLHNKITTISADMVSLQENVTELKALRPILWLQPLLIR